MSRRLVTSCYLLTALLALPGAALAGVRLGVDASGYPEIRATVVGSAASTRAPSLSEDGAAVVGLQAQNLGAAKAVVLALDRSQSMAGRSLADATTAAKTFVSLKGGSDQVAVVEFGRRAVELTGFSVAGGDADAALGAVRVDSRSGTALYDAVVLAAQQLGAQPLPGRVLVLLTDGRDVSSKADLDEAIAAARRARAGVYPVAVAGPQFDPSPLLRLARSTGGIYHRVGSSAQLAQVYASIAAELARTWRLRYTTAARPGDSLALHAALPSQGAADATLRLPTGLGGAPTGPAKPTPLIPSSLYSSTGTLVVGAIVFALALTAVWMLFAVGAGVRLRSRIEAHVAPVSGRKRSRRSSRSGLFAQLLLATERAFGHLRQWKSLARLLERADLPLRTAEFVYIQLGSAMLLGLFVAAAAASPLATLVALAVGAALPLGFASFRARRRLRAFENQLPDLLITLAASLKAGHSFRQGIQTVVDEGRPPAAEEFKRVLTETSLGRPMDDALSDMAERVGSKNLEFVITAVTIQRQVGGSLAGLFDMVAEAVRQRQQFARKIRGLTAMGRMSAYVLIGLPFFLAGALTFLNPSYMSPLFHTSTGHTLIFIGMAMMAFGSVVLRKIVSFRG